MVVGDSNRPSGLSFQVARRGFPARIFLDAA
jgi:hypothetical protein